ncbi:FxsA family protein [Candidatus Parabeggiatoa sp. HSG14]|uniref:FxsA family protein n=1 Tax=Candidatus Parabeggiatoa sp. HSG14 TaxID=3055593 RepID=UPI0025A8F5D1|nr:FxsA family protein [Thiotrichales bacterium HSG14]
MNLSQGLLLLFIIIPIFEIYLLITVGSIIGGWLTILLVVLTAILGASLLRIQGLATLQKVHDSLQKGVIPTEALLEGILLLFGGALLLTPGFFTDTIGFACLIPTVRKYLIFWWIQRIQVKHSYKSSPKQPRKPTTLEGEYRREDE